MFFMSLLTLLLLTVVQLSKNFTNLPMDTKLASRLELKQAPRSVLPPSLFPFYYLFFYPNGSQLENL